MSQQAECDKNKRINYLTIHGHFYQPPRENPWLEAIEVQDSAKPFHDWNERVNFECYNPNSVSRIVNNHNKIIDIVNNYRYISFNFGPTLLSWMEVHSPKTYEKIIEADNLSMQEHNGHGNAIAQVYNHMIMPLANEADKYTQTIWGIKDFIYRFGHKPEGIWLAETAIDYNTVDVLIECGIKFTVLSPFQAQKVREMDKQGAQWNDVGNGNIDPGRAYRCYSKKDPEKYLDVFFYDGAISKSVAFDNLLQNGEKFVTRLKDGISPYRNYNQLVNIATDGESYGHHTKFGDMALSYILKSRVEKEGFKITNYGEYLSLEPPVYEVELKPVSSWSCFHGVERWNSDCGCQTGGQPNWNQKWRTPLRQALNYLRDELIEVFEHNTSEYVNDIWKARNDYIDVILDRSEDNAIKFLQKYQKYQLSKDEITKAIKLFEMQRQAMLMYTSCGWFFCEVSGLETVQIMKYAARAIQIAQEFTTKDIETQFLSILSQAQSNILEYGTAKDIYERWVRPSTVDIKKFISHWAITSIYHDYDYESDIHCWEMKRRDYRSVKNGANDLVIGRIEAVSKITFEKHDMIFAMLHFANNECQCTVRPFNDITEFNNIKSELVEAFERGTLTDVIRLIDENFGKQYYTFKDLFTRDKKEILRTIILGKMDKFMDVFESIYAEILQPVKHLKDVGIDLPDEFRVLAEFIFSRKFNTLITNAEKLINEDVIAKGLTMTTKAQSFGVQIYKEPSKKIFEEKILRNIDLLWAGGFEAIQARKLFNLLSISKQLEIHPNIQSAQNIYFEKILGVIPEFINSLETSQDAKNFKQLITYLINIGELLDFDVKEYYIKLSNIKL